jgi:hypothetical protein
VLPRIEELATGTNRLIVTRLLSALPRPIGRAVAKANNKGLRLHDSMRVEDYPS